MTPDGPEAIGDRIAVCRKARRMTQRQLADVAIISLSLLQKVEQGNRAATPAVLAAIARALNVDDAHLSGDPRHNAGRVRDVIPRSLHRIDIYDLPDAGPVKPLSDLNAATKQAMAYRLESQYARLAATLPGLLGDLTRAAHTCTGRQSEQVIGLLAMAYRAADAIADKYGYTDLSGRAIELMRWAAAQAGDPLLRGMAAYVRTELFLTSRHPVAGLHALDIAITSMDPPTSRDAIAICGSLHMRAAVTAANAGLTEPAADHLAQARELAQRVPDGVYYGTAFGPSSVRIHQAATAAELGDAAAVLQLAKSWQPPATVPAERRSHYFIELARAQVWAGQRNDALASLHAAQKIAPQHVRCNPAVRRTVATLMRVQRHPTERLLSFARGLESARSAY